MKNASTGNTRNKHHTTVDDWEGAVIKKNGVEIGRVKNVRGSQAAPIKKQVAIRLDVDVLEALRASGAGWQTRLNASLRAVLNLSGKLNSKH